MGSRGTKPGALFTPVDDEIRQAIHAACKPSISRFCRDRKMSFDTVHQIICGETKWVSDDVLKRVGVFQDFEDREWKSKMAWPIGRPGGRVLALRQGKTGPEKRCNCPKHQGAWVPLSNFSFHRSGARKGKPFSQCKDGDHRARRRNWTGQHGFVPVARVKFAWMELVRRVGVMEASRRCGIKPAFHQRVENQQVVRKATANGIFNALAQARANNEVRHRLSIRRGSALRGEREREIVNKQDFNYPQGDADNEAKRRYNADHPKFRKEQNSTRQERFVREKARSL